MISPVGQNNWSWYGYQRQPAESGNGNNSPDSDASAIGQNPLENDPQTDTAGRSTGEDGGRKIPAAGAGNKSGPDDSTPLSAGKNEDNKIIDVGDLRNKMAKRIGIKECQTCKNRKYQDGSDDPGVSFKTPTRISPDQAATAVMAHEEQHVSHEQARAKEEGRKVVSQSVQLQTSVCPECGRIYVSGGVTKTQTAAQTDSKPSASEQSQSSGKDAKPSIDLLA